MVRKDVVGNQCALLILWPTDMGTFLEPIL